MPEATNGYETITVSDAQMSAYKALEKAAEQIGRNNFARLGPARFDRRGNRIGGYDVTPEHSAIVETMPRVLSGEVEPEAAMALLHQPDIMR